MRQVGTLYRTKSPIGFGFHTGPFVGHNFAGDSSPPLLRCFCFIHGHCKDNEGKLALIRRCTPALRGSQARQGRIDKSSRSPRLGFMAT